MVFANIPASYADSLKGDRFVALYNYYIMTAKTTPYPSCHRDNFQAKATRKVAGWQRRVTLTNYTAWPLSATIPHQQNQDIIKISDYGHKKVFIQARTASGV